MAREWYERERRRSGWAERKGGGRRKERTAGNDARTDVEKKKDGKISGSIFDPEKGAALPGGGGRGSGGGLGGVGGREK